MTFLRKATPVLDALANSPRALTLSELADRTGLPRSTVHRVLQSLEQERYVLRSSGRCGYALGPGLIKFGISGLARIVSENRRILTTLVSEVGETFGLTVFSGYEAIVVDEAAPRPRLVPPKVGNNAELHATASGRAILAQMPEKRAERLLPTDLARLTGRTIVDRTEVLRQIDEARRSGIATSMEEHDVGIIAIATAVADQRGLLHAVTSAIPTQRLRGKAELIVSGLRRVNPGVNVDLALRQLHRRPARAVGVRRGR